MVLLTFSVLSTFFSLQSTLGCFQAFSRGGEVPKEEFRGIAAELDTLFG